MGVVTELLPPESWTYEEGQHVWQQPKYLDANVPYLCFVARRASKVTGRWVVPLMLVGTECHAVREPRLLPYATPQILDDTPRGRRETLKSLMSALMEKASVIELPLEPGFHEIGAFSELGAFCEARHTHLASTADFDVSRFPRTVRNHIASAAKDTIVVVNPDLSQFAFERAIVDSRAAVVRQRRQLALRLAQDDRVTVLEARRGDRVAGQLLIVRTGTWAVFMHSWFDRVHAARGLPTLLTVRGIEHSLREMRVERVDLEGSIIAAVDEFMDGLGTFAAIYPTLYWARDASDLIERLRSSLDIPGRCRVTDANGSGA